MTTENETIFDDEWAKTIADRIKQTAEDQRLTKEFELLRSQKIKAHAGHIWARLCDEIERRVEAVNLRLSKTPTRPYVIEKPHVSTIVVEKPKLADGGSDSAIAGSGERLEVEYNEESYFINYTVKCGRAHFQISMADSGEFYLKSHRDKNVSLEQAAKDMLESLMLP